MLETPVAFFVFNRPDTTRRVFAEISKAKPRKLLLIADGPRSDRPGEAALCAEVRSIIEKVDWDCDVLTNYADGNLGCKIRVSSGLDWVFDQYEEAIILEDDCLPDQSFFNFCQEILAKYRDDKRVMVVSGTNFLNGKISIDHSYYFSRYPSIWGWASWRRAWQYFDINIDYWQDVKEKNIISNIISNNQTCIYWEKVFTKLYNDISNDVHGSEWDYIWMLCCWLQNGLTVVPNVNLISNIGFSDTATTTTEHCITMASIPTSRIEFPLMHPKLMYEYKKADHVYFEQTNPWVITPPGFYYWLRKHLLPYSPKLIRKTIQWVRAKLGYSASYGYR